MEQFSQNHAARISGYDDRTFRSLVDRGIILPTPETRKLGRGKAKTFDRHEVRVASIMNMLDLKLSVFEQARAADWLRRELAPVARQSSQSHPYYVVIETEPNDVWQGTFRQAGGDYRYSNGETTESEDRKISVMFEIDEGKTRAASRLVLANVSAALWWDSDDVIEFILNGDAEKTRDTAVATNNEVAQ